MGSVIRGKFKTSVSSLTWFNLPFPETFYLTSSKPHLHVSHLVSNDESAGQSLVSVEGAASCRIACSRHWGVARGAPYISTCQPHGYIVLSPELLVPTVHILERTLRVSVNHLEEGAQCCTVWDMWSCGHVYFSVLLQVCLLAYDSPYSTYQGINLK